MPIKTHKTKDEGRQKFYTHTALTKTLKHAHKHTTLCLSVYSHTHYADTQNKEMHVILFTLLHITQTTEEQT